MKQYFAFQWHITEDCDQRCKHCYIFAEDSKKHIISMDWKGVKKTIANIEDFCQTYGRLPYLYITGGDPILHPEFWKLMNMVKEKQIPFTILGNPFHLTEAVCKRLHDCGCEKYQLSIDGMRETHDWFRKPGSFDETLNKISVIKNAGIKAVIMTTVSDKNMKEVLEIIDTVVKYKADVFAFARYVPTCDEKSTGIPPFEYRNLLDACYKKFKSYEHNPTCVTWFNRKDHLWTLYEYEEGIWKIPEHAKKGMIYDGCNCGNCHLTILPDGEVYACRRVSESKVGNVFNDRLADLWIGKVEDYREYEKFTKCAGCELLAWCRGCPAVAKGTFGSFYAEDPQCWKSHIESKEM
ncbi:MAG: radical domain protein system [Neobacillus sp.]|jgi:radical SAM/SPASM domain protein of ACGX system|nr:radical domain protein system [Neobacillus sp.]